MSSKAKALLLPIMAAAALTAVLAAEAAATTSVTITTPKSGQSISLKRNPYTAVAGSVAFSPSDATTTRF